MWLAALNRRDEGRWIEPVQAYTQEYAPYVAILIHQASRSVIKVVRYGITMACFPNKETVERFERQIARQNARALVQGFDRFLCET